MIIENIKLSFRRIKWKLTLSYTAVTVGSLLSVVLILGYVLFSRTFIPLELYDDLITPEDWVQMISNNSSHIWQVVLAQDPIDQDLVAVLMGESDLTITTSNFFQMGGFQINLQTVAQGSAFLVDSDGVLLGSIFSDLVTEEDIGKPLDTGILPGLETALAAALSGEDDPDQVFVTIEPRKRFHFSLPIIDEDNQEVLGAAVIYIEHLPTSTDIPTAMWTLVGRSVLLLLLAVGVVGTLFGAFSSRGMVERMGQVSAVTDAWSRGDFTEFIQDSAGDEISTLAERLNHMAEQLQQFLKRSQEMAVSEERNRLARDLHDSAKQEALAASFHLGTAVTLFERDPGSAKNHLVEASNLIDSVRKELTDLIHELRPPSMNGTRFEDTLNEYIIEWAHQTEIEANMDVNGFIDLPLEIKQAIYRIMQEGLANIARHSSASAVDINLNFSEQLVEFCILDNGIGFDPQLPTSGMGLDSMRERVEKLNGRFSIESQPGQGTKIYISIPIETGGLE